MSPLERFSHTLRCPRALPRSITRVMPALIAAVFAVQVIGSLHAAANPRERSFARVPQSTRSTGDALLALAAAEIASMQETHYTHHTVIDHDAGIYDTDCSGFLDDLLQQVAPAALAAIPVEQGFPGPRAYLFERFFAALLANGDQPGWNSVARLADAQPGDILAWELEPFDPESDTGHVVVIAAIPWQNADGSYSVPVDDASILRHDDDTRTPGVGGIGAGTITVRVDAAGAPSAFRFAAHDHFHTAPIAIGRLTGAAE